MKPRLSILLPLLQSLICLGVLVLWLRSYWIVNSLSWRDTKQDISLTSSGGRLVYMRAIWPNGRAWAGLQHAAWPRGGSMPWWERTDGDPDRHGCLGFEWSQAVFPFSTDGPIMVTFCVPPHRLIAVPYWFVLAITALPLLRRAARAYRRHRRRVRGQCPACGYDLRATPARCPECGAGHAPPN